MDTVVPDLEFHSSNLDSITLRWQGRAKWYTLEYRHIEAVSVLRLLRHCMYCTVLYGAELYSPQGYTTIVDIVDCVCHLLLYNYRPVNIGPQRVSLIIRHLYCGTSSYV